MRKETISRIRDRYSSSSSRYRSTQRPNGKLDMKGYMTTLAQRLFSGQIMKAAIKQAISKDRDQFTDGVLKNTTLRNNSGDNPIDAPLADFYVDAMGK